MKAITLNLIITILFLPVFLLLPSKLTGNDNSNYMSELELKNGDSFKNAVLIIAKNQEEGVNKQYMWITQHYPNSHVASSSDFSFDSDEDIIFTPQRLIHQDERFYSVITIITPQNQVRDIYFDITEYFGKTSN